MAKKTSNYLALDLGAESGRGIIGRFDGKTIQLEEVYRFQHTLMHYRGTLRWDVLMMTLHLREALKAAAAKTRGALASLGVDTWGVDYVLLDKNGDLLGYPYHYRDARNDVAMPAAFKKVGQKAIFDVTGLQFMGFNTLFQLYAEVTSKSGRLDAAKIMLFMPDFLSYSLGGDPTAEYTIASTSQMLDAKKRAWAKPLIEKLGIPTGILPQIVKPGTVTGHVSAEVAALTGASESIKIVAPGRHDTASAVAAAPVVGGDDWAYISSGTWSLFGVELKKPIISDAVMANSYTNEGGLNGTIRFLTNIMGLWIVQELRRAWTDAKGNAPSYAELAQAAADSRPFGAVINPNWAPFGKPGQMPAKITKFCKATGQKPPRTQGEFVRCALESLALIYRASLDRLEELQGRKIRRIHIIGGGCQNKLLNQLAADACDCEIHAGPVEATAMGNILGQMLADGQIASLEEGRQIVANSCKPEIYKPNHTEQWAKAYEKFKDLAATDVPVE